MSNELFKCLNDDHTKLKSHLAQMIEASEVNQPLNKGDLDILRSLLIAHDRAEEHVLYDALKQRLESEKRAYESYEEHRISEAVLNELEQVSNSKVLCARLNVLKELLTHHIDEEESATFNEAKKIFSDDEFARMAHTFIDLREQIQSDILGEPLENYSLQTEITPPSVL